MRLGRWSSGLRRVVAVPLAYRHLPHFEAVREYLGLRLVEAWRQGGQLLVLPALAGALTLPLFARDPLDSPAAVREAAWTFGGAAEETLLDWARSWARELGVFLVPGTCLVPGERGVLQRAYLFSPDGRLLGVQAQTHVRADDLEFGLVAGCELEVWDAGGLRVGMAVGSDAWTPEVGRILALEGATVLLCPTAVRTPYSVWWQMAGPWQLAQANCCFAVESSLAGELGGVRFTGRAAVIAPADWPGSADGFLARAIHHGREAAIGAELDLRQLTAWRGGDAWLDGLNRHLYATVFPRLYWERLQRLGFVTADQSIVKHYQT